jgi:hypothetical protein
MHCISNYNLQNVTEIIILLIIVTCGLKAGTCVAAGRSFARHVLMVTKYTVTMGFDGRHIHGNDILNTLLSPI